MKSNPNQCQSPSVAADEASRATGDGRRNVGPANAYRVTSPAGQRHESSAEATRRQPPKGDVSGWNGGVPPASTPRR
jgi:hypothetical protein